MSTRSFIGQSADSGAVCGIYCHFDGYPSGVGKTLRDSYDTAEAVSDLLSFGDASSLGDTVSGCTFYARDRGEKGVESRLYDSHADFFKAGEDSNADYIYLFEESKWRCFTTSGTEVDLYSHDFRVISLDDD